MPSLLDPGIRLIDGEDNSDISCTVKGGGTFSVAASLSYAGSTLSIRNGQVTAGGTGTATVSLYTPESFDLSSPASSPCTIDVSPTTSANFQIQSGSMWGSFNCPVVEKDAQGCRASGIIVLENCTE